VAGYLCGANQQEDSLPTRSEITTQRPIRLRYLVALPVMVSLAASLLWAADSSAADHSAMAGHNHMSLPDERQFVAFPPEMRANQLRDMRDHVAALSGIFNELSSGNYEGAAKLADERLGLDSPSAAGCKAKPAGAPPAAKGPMEEMMNLYMPEPMRATGLAMHSSASEFASVARSAAKTGDTKAVFGALSKVTANCVACHSAYRVQ
jgi:hypothetical protein